MSTEGERRGEEGRGKREGEREERKEEGKGRDIERVLSLHSAADRPAVQIL